MNHQSKAETPSGVIAAFAGCGLMRQANFYPEGIAMKFVDQPNVLPEVKEKAKRHIEAVNAWLDGMSGTMVCVKTIHAGQTRPYGPSVYESVIYCLQPNCNTVGAPLPRVIDEAEAKAIARIFVHTFDDEPKDWASAKLQFLRPEPDPCFDVHHGMAARGFHSCWRVQITLEYTD
jgi:hypothetical protein